MVLIPHKNHHTNIYILIYLLKVLNMNNLLNRVHGGNGRVVCMHWLR